MIADKIADKPGSIYDLNCEIRVIEDVHPYASRGGIKLEHALNEFNVSKSVDLFLSNSARSCSD